MKLAHEPASSRPKPCASLKKPHESCSFAAPCGPRRKKNDRDQTISFSLKSLPVRALWLIKYYDGEITTPSTLSLGYPLLGPFSSRLGMRSPAPTFSAAAIHCAMKRPAPCSAVLRHFPSSWAAVSRPLVGVDTESSEVFQKTPIHYVCFLPPNASIAPTTVNRRYFQHAITISYQ